MTAPKMTLQVGSAKSATISLMVLTWSKEADIGFKHNQTMAKTWELGVDVYLCIHLVLCNETIDKKTLQYDP